VIFEEKPVAAAMDTKMQSEITICSLISSVRKHNCALGLVCVNTFSIKRVFDQV